MHTLAYIVIGLSLFNVVAQPAPFGRSRGTYGYGSWISGIISTLMIGALALRALGVI